MFKNFLLKLNYILKALNIIKKDYEVTSTIKKKKLETSFICKTFLFNKIKIRTTSLTKPFTGRNSKEYEQYKEIFYFCNVEINLLYFFIVYYLKNLPRPDKILIVTDDKKITPLFDYLCPNINYQILDLKEDLPGIENIYYSNLVITYINFYQIARFINASVYSFLIGTTTLYELFLKALDLKQEEISFQDISVPKYIQDNIREKIDKIGLNSEKFVFISPESTYTEKYDQEFWTSLCNELNNKGYDIFLYKTSPLTKLKNCKYKTCKLDISEAITLASMSKGIVSLRSNFCELTVHTKAPLFILYNDFKSKFFEDDIDVYSTFYGYSLKDLPNINIENLFEINVFEESDEKIITKITENIDNKN